MCKKNQAGISIYKKAKQQYAALHAALDVMPAAPPAATNRQKQASAYP
jgi:hypothetical protein